MNNLSSNRLGRGLSPAVLPFVFGERWFILGFPYHRAVESNNFYKGIRCFAVLVFFRPKSVFFFHIKTMKDFSQAQRSSMLQHFHPWFPLTDYTGKRILKNINVIALLL